MTCYLQRSRARGNDYLVAPYRHEVPADHDLQRINWSEAEFRLMLAVRMAANTYVCILRGESACRGFPWRWL